MESTYSVNWTLLFALSFNLNINRELLFVSTLGYGLGLSAGPEVYIVKLYNNTFQAMLQRE